MTEREYMEALKAQRENEAFWDKIRDEYYKEQDRKEADRDKAKNGK